MSNPPTCDLFCRVIDNHGDIGVCWRLARQLHVEHGWQVRLWLDDLSALAALAPDTTGVDVRAWKEDFPRVQPAEIVIEAFACELPENYLTAMAALEKKPVWINLEYLCVESWGPDFHCKPSPHPRLPLLKHFFVPGVLPGTGGLLLEHDLLARRAGHGTSGASDALRIFLFCYDNPALPWLLDAWTGSPRPIHCRVAAGKPAAQTASWLKAPLVAGEPRQRGSLTLEVLPFVPQADFDALLWESDLNFVRGEDSFARAQWAALPFIWHIYPQAENAHYLKLDSFLSIYTQGLPMPVRQALLDFCACWNGQAVATPEHVRAAWAALEDALPALAAHAAKWREHLISLGNLAKSLAIFCKER